LNRQAVGARFRTLATEVAKDWDPPCADQSAARASYEELWSLLGSWATRFLDRHPRASAQQLLADLKPLMVKAGDTDVFTATAVRLQTGARAAYVLAPVVWGKGSFFILARDRAGRRFRVAWSIEPLAAAHFAQRDDTGYWAFSGHGINDGALVGTVHALSRSRAGHPRFFVDALSTPIMGCTFPGQLSVWEWRPSTAVPLLIKQYTVACDTPPLRQRGNLLEIPTKEDLKVIHECGECTDPAGLWTVEVTPDGVIDHGHALNEPEIGIIDDLLARVRDGHEVEPLSTPEIGRAVHAAFETSEGDCNGMTDAYSIEHRDGATLVKVVGDKCCGTEMLFRIEQREQGPTITAFECQ
jgi:hypothetical protein